jgi:hypothetical protein
MATRMRWSNTGASPIGPRDGAMLRSPVTDAAPVRSPKPTHVHVHMPGPAPVRDQVPPRRPAVRRGDQAAEPGQLQEGGGRPDSCCANLVNTASPANGAARMPKVGR